MAPNADQIEITLFGPGYGESILVHLGNNHWVIIDSCIDSKTSQPASLSYLSSLGIDASKAVKLVIATHWDDDHIRGLSEVFSECKSAKFCASSALGEKEFIATVCRFNEGHMMADGSGVREIRKIYEILETRTPINAISNRVVYNLPADQSGHGKHCKIWTLSPSDKQFEKFLMEITKLMPKLNETKFRAINQGPNSLSVVTWIEIGNLFVLLGGDLEETGDDKNGWSAIVASKERPKGKASIYKIPHHGSKNAHNHDVWEDMLIKNSFGVLTPFTRGNKKLPSANDIGRILGYSKNCYSTAKIQPGKIKKMRSSAVEKTIKEIVGKIRRTEATTGGVRLRNRGEKAFDEWDVTLLENACPLEQIYEN